jgi:hypothetical protein
MRYTNWPINTSGQTIQGNLQSSLDWHWLQKKMKYGGETSKTRDKLSINKPKAGTRPVPPLQEPKTGTRSLVSTAKSSDTDNKTAANGSETKTLPGW